MGAEHDDESALARVVTAQIKGNRWRNLTPLAVARAVLASDWLATHDAEVRADERRRCVGAASATLRRDHAVPPKADGRSWRYRDGFYDGVYHAARVVSGLGGEEVDCGHPNHAADDHACRPFLGGEEVEGRG